jgi:probable rRNA maturation factor
MADQPPPRRRVRGNFEFLSDIPGARVRKDFALDCAVRAASKIRGPIAEIRFVLVGDRKMSALHKKFMSLSGTTDVLTFELSAPREPLEGEIYICLDQARRQARDYRVPLYQEIARLATHGVLHLAGYDDATDAQRVKMRRMEDLTLTGVRT